MSVAQSTDQTSCGRLTLTGVAATSTLYRRVVEGAGGGGAGGDGAGGAEAELEEAKLAEPERGGGAVAEAELWRRRSWR